MSKDVYRKGDDPQFDAYLEAKCTTGRDVQKAIDNAWTLKKPKEAKKPEPESGDVLLDLSALGVLAGEDPTFPSQKALQFAKAVSDLNSNVAKDFLQTVKKHNQNMGKPTTMQTLVTDLNAIMNPGYGKSK